MGGFTLKPAESCGRGSVVCRSGANCKVGGGGLDQWHALALKKPFFFAFKKFSMDLNRKHAYINTFLF